MSICSVEGVKAALDSLSKKPVKSLGQCFLINPALRDQIISHTRVAGMSMLEIGPGTGALTEGILQGGAIELTVVEKDALLAKRLSEQFAQDKRLTVISGDILRVSLEELFEPEQRPYCVVGALPYYITSPILMRLLSYAGDISSMVFIIQAEAAQRIFAKPSDKVYGPLSIASQLFYDAQKLCPLSPDDFYPQPKVSSVAIRLVRSDTAHDASFIPFIRSCFNMKRRTLQNNLSSMGYSHECINKAYRELNIKQDARAQALEPHTLLQLFNTLKI